MDVHCEYGESTKSILSYDNINCFSKAEDSGYHTSFTPGSLERSDLSSDYLGDRSVVTTTAFIDQIQVDYVTPGGTYRYNQLKPRNDNGSETPPQRRAIKRPHSSISSIESTKHLTTIPTPTTWIAGKIQSLEVSEDKENATISIPKESAHSSERSTRFICRLNIREKTYSYPITPVKRNCISPCRKSGRKLDFVIHSLSCEKDELQPGLKKVSQTKIEEPILARLDQKIDILSLLNQKSAIPPLQKIFQYLSNEDICNFCSVSTAWSGIWNSHNTDKKKLEVKQYLKTAKENQENVYKDSKVEARSTKLFDGCLKEIHNLINDKVPRSPQYSPRTNRFRNFIKCASQDPRLQLSCVRCSQPAKVTVEASGEEWVECTSAPCSYQFCRSCNCSRHPGKSCTQYDLNAPSPSKRKKCDYAVGTKKSRKNLRRLLNK